MGMSQEQAAAAFHAAKMAQLNVMGHNFDKILPSHLDLSKLGSQDTSDANQIQSSNNVTIESTNSNILSSYRESAINANANADIKRNDSEPMNLGLDNNQSTVATKDNANVLNMNMSSGCAPNSSGEDEYASDDDEGDHERDS